MSQIILGKDILEYREVFSVGVTDEFFELIDPEGTNVLIDNQEREIGDTIEFIGLFKFKERTTPLEMYASLPKKVFKKIVHEIDIKSLRETH